MTFSSLKPGLEADQRVIDGLNDPEYKTRLLRRDILRLIAFAEFDALAFEKCGHGRIDRGVRARDGEILRAHGGGHGAHGGAADADEVNVTDLLFHECRERGAKVAGVLRGCNGGKAV